MKIKPYRSSKFALQRQIRNLMWWNKMWKMLVLTTPTVCFRLGYLTALHSLTVWGGCTSQGRLFPTWKLAYILINKASSCCLFQNWKRGLLKCLLHAIEFFWMKCCHTHTQSQTYSPNRFLFYPGVAESFIGSHDVNRAALGPQEEGKK